MIERSIFISDPLMLEYIKNKTFNRLYFGHESCSYYINNKNIDRSFVFAEKMNLPFTLVIPTTPQEQLEKIEKLISGFNSDHPDNEIVFNDLGLLYKFRKVKNKIIGRSLIKNNVCFSMHDYSKLLPFFITEIPPFIEKIANKLNVNRIELNAAYKIKNLSGVFSYSLYKKLYLVASGLQCASRNYTRPVFSCNKKCKITELHTKSNEKLVFSGNALYINRDCKNVNNPLINREIYYVPNKNYCPNF